MANCVELGQGLPLPGPSGPPVQPPQLLASDMDYTLEQPNFTGLEQDTLDGFGDPSDGMDAAIAQIFSDLVEANALVLSGDPLLAAIAAEESAVDSFDASDVAAAVVAGVANLQAAMDDTTAALGGVPTAPTVPQSSGIGGPAGGYNDTITMPSVNIPQDVGNPVLVAYKFTNPTKGEIKFNNLFVGAYLFTPAQASSASAVRVLRAPDVTTSKPNFLPAPAPPITVGGTCDPTQDVCNFYSPDWKSMKLQAGESETFHIGFMPLPGQPLGLYQLGLGFAHDQETLYWALLVQITAQQGPPIETLKGVASVR